MAEPREDPPAGDAPAAAESRRYNAELERRAAALPPLHTVPPPETRRQRRAGEGPYPAPVLAPRATTLTVPGTGGEITLRVLAPRKGPPTGVYLHLHGGGWTIGDADEQDPLLTGLADATGLCVAGVRYRLAPEHPWPTAPDDCEAAARWLLREGAVWLGAPARYAIGGESAGAHLATLALLRLRDRPEPAGAFRAACLSYGWFDLGRTPSLRRWDRSLVLSAADLDWFLDNFLPGLDPEQRRAPHHSPLYADLAGLCPAHFSVGTADPLLDDTLFLAARWQAAGNAADLAVWPDAAHGFHTFPLTVATRALHHQHTFLRHLFPT